MGAAEVRSLKYSDFVKSLKEYDFTGDMTFKQIRKIIQDEKCFGTWNIRRIKTGMPYITFSTPEAN